MSHHILICDGDEATLDVLTNYLGEGGLGYEVTVAATGEDAVCLSALDAFDLCLLATGLPDDSGAGVWRRIKNLHPCCEVFFYSVQGPDDPMLDSLRFAIPADRLMLDPLGNLPELTRSIVGILGPPAVRH